MPADYIMIGGFLGAGKTTSIARLARHLAAQGRRVGLITNDQSYGLVDTAILRSQGHSVEEITGGCFCCRFNSLVEASEKLTAQSAPDVFIAEPVGSCTDLRAAVSYPLRRLYGSEFSVAPLSVLVDPIRAERILGLTHGSAFSPKVLYVYDRQLEEADLIVVNKTDLLSASRLDRLLAALRSAYPRASIISVSARNGDGLEEWFSKVTSNVSSDRTAPDVDYEIYAEGEALLGWCNASCTVRAGSPFDGNQLLLFLAGSIQSALAVHEVEIAHLKMTLSPADDAGDIGVVNLVRSGAAPDLAYSLREPLECAELFINLRAEGDPELIRASVENAVVAYANLDGNVKITIEHMEHFRPAKPTPTYRLAAV
jgi:G3E family GTPase